jgi:3-hydroxyacyl-[acyl-carrier-protein] dehydratase
MPPPLILDPAQLDLSKVVADRAAIRQVNLQRFDMEQLDAVCLLDPAKGLIVGYKDVRPDEFWVRGHFPSDPLMPGVLMCEAAAQLGSYYTISQKISPHSKIGFGGMEGVRFRALVRPGDRLVLVGQGKRLRAIQTVFNVQGFVGSTLAFHGDFIGMPLGKSEGGGS